MLCQILKGTYLPFIIKVGCLDDVEFVFCIVFIEVAKTFGIVRCIFGMEFEMLSISSLFNSLMVDFSNPKSTFAYWPVPLSVGRNVVLWDFCLRFGECFLSFFSIISSTSNSLSKHKRHSVRSLWHSTELNCPAFAQDESFFSYPIEVT